MQSLPHPRVVATIGLHGSASTWVFNIVRELMLAEYGAALVQSLVADTLGELPDAATVAQRHLVVKSHHGSRELDEWLQDCQAQMILSVRDPRDACISMSQRFKAPLEACARWLADDCRRMLTLANGRMMLRYEERFFDSPDSVARLAATLGVSPGPADLAALFERYRTAAVRNFAERLCDLPAERLTAVGSSHWVDQVTQIHGVHIGDARSQKWRGLPAPVQRELTRRFAPFLERFGYSM